jgi:hypothetical protein
MQSLNAGEAAPQTLRLARLKIAKLFYQCPGDAFGF